MNPQHDPLDPQERALARLLDPTPVPPAELDARILAAARAASRPTQPKAPRRHRRWPVALGLAASVTLAIGVAWQLREPPRPAAELAIVADAVLPAATADMPPPPPPAPDAPTAAERPAPVDPLTAEAHRAAVAAGTERSRQRSEKAGRQVELQAEAEAASRSEAVRAQETAVATAQVRATQRAEKAARQADLQAAAVEVEQARAQEVAAAAALARASQRVVQAERQESAIASAPPAPVAAAPAPVEEVAEAPPTDAYPAPAPAPPLAESVVVDGMTPAVAVAVGEDERLPAPEWLQRIRERRDRGQIEEARASLERFRVTHPTTPVPADLKPLAR